MQYSMSEAVMTELEWKWVGIKKGHIAEQTTESSQKIHRQ